jgi:hypothetical protein
VKPRTTFNPKLIMAHDVARLMDWPTWKARRWLKATGAGEKRGSRYVTTLAKLLAHFPEVAREVLTVGVEFDDESDA